MNFNEFNTIKQCVVRLNFFDNGESDNLLSKLKILCLNPNFGLQIYHYRQFSNGYCLCLKDKAVLELMEMCKHFHIGYYIKSDDIKGCETIAECRMKQKFYITEAGLNKIKPALNYLKRNSI